MNNLCLDSSFIDFITFEIEMAKKGMNNWALSVLLLFSAGALQAMPTDSVGRKISGGKYYLLHKISNGETLYGVCRKYGTTAGEVTAANPGLGTSFQIDKVIMIPRKWGMSSPVSSGNGNSSTSAPGNTEQPRTAVNSGQTIRHEVAKGEALGIISRKYGVTVAAIKEENNLSNDNVRIGQILKIPAAKGSIAETVSVATTNNTTGNNNATTEPVSKSTNQASSQVLVAPANPLRTGESRDPGMAGANTGKTSYEPVVDVNEEGKAVISNKEGLDQSRNFIIHPNARVGTIVMLTNPSTNVRVFARVVGNYRTSENPGAAVQVTKVVADALSGGISEFPVKINYAR